MIWIGRLSAARVLTSIFVILAGTWSGFLVSRQFPATALDRLESFSLDWRYWLAGTRTAPRGIVIAAIDDDTIRRGGSFPLPRSTLARIVRGLANLNPQVIAIDMLLIDQGPLDGDQELAEALRSTRSVIGAAALFDTSNPPAGEQPLSRGNGEIPRPTSILRPLDTFRAVARWGLSNVLTDEFGVPRYVPMLFETEGMAVPSFALAAAAAALNTDPAFGNDFLKLGARSVDMDVGYHLPIRFYGPRGTIRTLSAFRAVDGDLMADDVQGQVVVLGAMAAGLGDRFATPFDRSMPGVEVLATAIGNLLAGDGLIRNDLTRRIDASVSVGLAIGVVLLLAIPHISLAIGLSLALFALWLAATFVAFNWGYWLGIAVPAGASVPVAISFGIARLWLVQRRAKRLASESETLRRFQAPRLAELLTRDPLFLSTPVSQHAAIVFLDLSGYTTVTEAVGPAWTRELLATLHNLIETAATACQGFVISYMGDGAMILFGIPAPRSNDACHALNAIVRLFADISAWLETLPPVARKRLAVRVAGHFGPVVLSRLGAATHQHIAATGDTVNVASRLLEVAKQRHAGIAVSEDLFGAASRVTCEAANVAGYIAGEVAIRGRTRPLAVRLAELRVPQRGDEHQSQHGD